MLKKITKKIYKELKKIQALGFLQYVKYNMTSKGILVKIKIKENHVVIRKGTPDLRVAISSLGGEFDIMKHLFDSDYDGFIIDAGGYIGTSAIALNKLFPNAKIIIVEPSLANIEIMRKNLVAHPEIKIIYGALVGEPKDKIQLKNRLTGEWGFTVVPDPADKPQAETMCEVPAFMIEDLVEKAEDIGILKLDIEGGEFEILEKDAETLRRISVIFAELHDRIVPGCYDRFVEFSKSRILIKDNGEKYLSIKK